MTFKTHCQMSKGMVDPAPLVNVVFLLLLFFVLNSSVRHAVGLRCVAASGGYDTADGHVPNAGRHRGPGRSAVFQRSARPHRETGADACARPCNRTRVRELIIKADKQVSHRNRDRDHECRESGRHHDGQHGGAAGRACGEPGELSGHEARPQAVLRARATDAVDFGRVHRGVRLDVSFLPGFRRFPYQQPLGRFLASISCRRPVRTRCWRTTPPYVVADVFDPSLMSLPSAHGFSRHAVVAKNRSQPARFGLEPAAGVSWCPASGCATTTAAAGAGRCGGADGSREDPGALRGVERQRTARGADFDQSIRLPCSRGVGESKCCVCTVAADDQQPHADLRPPRFAWV